MEQSEIEEKLKRLRLEVEKETQKTAKEEKKAIKRGVKDAKKKAGKIRRKGLYRKISLCFNALIMGCVFLGIALIAWAKMNPVYSLIRGKKTEERIEIITKHIVENMTYNYIPGIEYNNGKDALERGGAVCDGYTRAFQRLAILNGIQADVACGIAGTASGAGYHAWNRVKLNGKWYWHDVTWIDQDQGDAMNMKYYMSEKLWPDHIVDNGLTEQYKKRIREIDHLLDSL